MATTVSLGKRSTIESFVSGGDSVKVKYSALSLNDMMGDSDLMIEFPTFNVYDDYIDDFMNAATEVTLTDEQHRQYYQAPKLLANELYHNSELDFILMRINGVYDPKDFTFRKVKVINMDTLNDMLSKILISNSRMIDVYNEDNPMD